jgi:hypothetical protein
MRAKTTLFLLLLVVALAALILGVERYLPSTREMLEMKRGPLKFEQSKITQIDIDSSGGDGVSLALDGARWWVRRPFNDLADTDKATKLLTELGAIGWIERVHRKEFDNSAWTKTSLDQPRYKLRLMAAGTLVLECWVGAPSAIEGGQYLALLPSKPGGEIAYYVAKTTISDWLKTAPKDWRDPKLLRLPANLVTGIRLAQGDGQIELFRREENYPWVFVKPLRTRGSKERIGELLSTLLNLEVKDAVEPISGKAAKETAQVPGELASAELKISVVLKGMEKAPLEITLKKPAKDATQTTATVNYRKPVFTVLSKSLHDLWAQPNDLRDRMLSRIDEDAVTHINISSVNFPPVSLRKESESWFLQRHGKWEAASGDRVSRFFDALNTHDIVEFTSDSASNLALYGLDKPFLTVGWTEGASTPMKLLFGKNTEGTEFFAKYEDEPSVYRIDASLLPRIPQDAIKWKGLGALRFTQFALRKISISYGTAPPVILKYDPTTAQWTGQRADRDITEMIDRVKADKLAGALAKFNVQDWAADRTDAIQALKTPALRVVITLGEAGKNTGPTRDISLSFAPTQANMDTAFYFGQVEGDPDIFYVTRPMLLELLAPVFKAP